MIIVERLTAQAPRERSRHKAQTERPKPRVMRLIAETKIELKAAKKLLDAAVLSSGAGAAALVCGHQIRGYPDHILVVCHFLDPPGHSSSLAMVSQARIAMASPLEKATVGCPCVRIQAADLSRGPRGPEPPRRRWHAPRRP